MPDEPRVILIHAVAARGRRCRAGARGAPHMDISVNIVSILGILASNIVVSPQKTNYRVPDRSDENGDHKWT